MTRLPLVTIAAARAAERILDACCRDGDAQLVMPLSTAVAVKLNALFPGAGAAVMGLSERILPGPGGSEPGCGGVRKASSPWSRRRDRYVARRPGGGIQQRAGEVTVTVSWRLVLPSVPIATLAALGCGAGDLVLPVGEGPAQIMVILGERADGPSRPAAGRLAHCAAGGYRGQRRAGATGELDGVDRRRTAVPQADTTDADGYASTKWTLGPSAGANALRAVLSGIGFVTFTAMGTGESNGPGPSAERSTISADPGSIAVSTGTSTITVRVRDGQGDPLGGATVTLAASGSGNTLIQPSGPTDSDGIVTGTLSSDVAESKVVSATVNGSVSLNETAQVTVTAAEPPPAVDHFVFRIQPHDVRRNERFALEVALVDVAGNVVPLNGIVIYLGLFDQAIDVTVNKRLLGNRFRETSNGVARFEDLGVTQKGTYQFRALSDQLPQLGPHGPEPYLFSLPFDVD